LISDKKEVILHQIVHFPSNTISGTIGKLISGTYKQDKIYALYLGDIEGLSHIESTYLALLLHKLGVKIAIMTILGLALNPIKSNVAIVNDCINFSAYTKPLSFIYNCCSPATVNEPLIPQR
jgi:hypothetical protein